MAAILSRPDVLINTIIIYLNFISCLHTQNLTHCDSMMPYGVKVPVNIGQGNGLLPDATKPLPELMLTSHQWDNKTVNQITGCWENFLLNVICCFENFQNLQAWQVKTWIHQALVLVILELYECFCWNTSVVNSSESERCGNIFLK